jgi:hypothetical protein
MKVSCSIATVDLPSEDGDRDIAGTEATCSRCGHSTECYGTTRRSITRCLVMMREECPQYENNFYEAE